MRSFNDSYIGLIGLVLFFLFLLTFMGVFVIFFAVGWGMVAMVRQLVKRGNKSKRFGGEKNG
jgi:hypothetical protein